jgi:hypothetical protein
VIIQLWSLAVLDQLRLVRSRRLVFAGHDGVRDVRTSSAVVRSRWVTTPQRLSRNTQQRTPRTINRAEANGDS